MRYLLNKTVSALGGSALAVVVGADAAQAQYAGDGSSSGAGAGTVQQLTEAGLYVFGLLALAALVVALYVYAPRVRVKRSAK